MRFGGLQNVTPSNMYLCVYEQEDNETTALWPQGQGQGGQSGNRSRLGSKTSKRSSAALSRVIVTFLKSMVGSYILYTPKVVIPRRGVPCHAVPCRAVPHWQPCCRCWRWLLLPFLMASLSAFATMPSYHVSHESAVGSLTALLSYRTRCCR